MPIKDNFQSLLILFKVAKALEIETLRELLAASIASYFRLRSMEDVRKEFGIVEYAPLITIDPAMLDVEKRFNWVFNENEKAKMEL